MDRVTLKSVFLKSQDSLREQLQGLKLPKDYAKLQQVISQHIEHLLVHDNEFNLSLNASDADMLNHTLRMALSFQQMTLTKSLDFKKMSNKTEYEIEQPTSNQPTIIESSLSVLPTILTSFINPWLAMVVGAGTIAVKVMRKGNKKVKVVEKVTDVSRIISDTEINTILSGLETLCAEVDSIITKIQRNRQDLLAQAQNNLNDCTFEKMYPQVLSALQYVFMKYIKSGKEDQLVQNLLFSMESYGYKMVEYSENVSGFFTKRTNPRVNEETMYLPAIVKGTGDAPIVVAFGIVYIPSK